MASRRIPIDMVIQDIAEGGVANVSFTVPQDDLADTLTAANEAAERLGAGDVGSSTNLAKLMWWVPACGHTQGWLLTFSSRWPKRMSVSA